MDNKSEIQNAQAQITSALGMLNCIHLPTASFEFGGLEESKNMLVNAQAILNGIISKEESISENMLSSFLISEDMLPSLLKEFIVDDIANADADFVREKFESLGVTQQVLDSLGVDYKLDNTDFDI